MKRYRVSYWDGEADRDCDYDESPAGEWAKAEEALAEIAKRDARIAELEAENVCDSCLGAGESLAGGRCMCGGTGKLTNGATYLREQLFDAKARIAELEGALRALVGEIESDSATRFYVGRADCPKCEPDPDKPSTICPYHSSKTLLDGEP